MAKRDPTMLLKMCPKCGGDLIVTHDVHGRYINCIQCGLLKDIEVGKASLPGDVGRDFLAERRAA